MAAPTTTGCPLTAGVRGRLTLTAAKSGRRVVRLLEGDPFVHPTGADEALACAKAGVPFEIVPGVCGATAIPAHAGVPLTAGRRRSVQVVDVSGKVDWRSGAADTLVLTQRRRPTRARGHRADRRGRAHRPRRSPSSPGVARSPSRPSSRLSSRLRRMYGRPNWQPPLLAVVGDVVDHRDALSWFETKPLFGWRVLVPRTRQQAGSLSAALRLSGAIPEEVPTISVEPPRNPQQIDKAVRGMVEGRYEWIAFTSVNALRAVKEKLVRVRPGRTGFVRPQGGCGRREDGRGTSRLGHRARPGALQRPVGARTAARLAAVRRGARPDQPGLPAQGRHRHRDPGCRTGRAGLGGRRRHRLPDGARCPTSS